MTELSSTPTEATTAPLLQPREAADAGESPRPTTLAMLLGRASGRRGPSMLVRETAARQLEERRADWGYSKPVVALDMMWNLSFVIVSVVMLIATVEERPNVPIRLWICGYALQCFVHVVLVGVEYRRRNTRRRRTQETVIQRAGWNSDANDSEDEEGSFGASNQSSDVVDGYVHFFILLALLIQRMKH
ncbi:unnamed protein product [Ilex paraguariensis]|uniref:RING-type E3 ubiquitin transferase n=1 Tax=Ilex paraguariensis TaxID=185542 RepID=A0ABC8QZ18_9AQUA